MDRPGLLDYAIFPLTWLERAKGRKRLGLIFAYFATLLVVGLWGWRVVSLWRLPDIGEPFDLVAFGTVDVPDASNAMVLYRQAAAKLVPVDPTVYKPVAGKAWEVVDWSSADPEVRRWVVDNRPASAIWLEGTDRPDCLFLQPRDVGTRSQFGPVFALRDFTRLALLEASRLQAEGDLVGSWRYLRASLRTGRHAGMHSGPMPRFMANQMLDKCRTTIQRWREDPGLTPDLLRRAIADVETCKGMSAPISEMIRAEYFSLKTALDAPERWGQFRLDGPEGEGEWYNHLVIVPTLRHFARSEPERSVRVNRIIAASRLAQCDRPRQDRPKLVSARYMIYEVDPKTPPAVAGLTAEELVSWADRSAYSSLTGDTSFMFARLELEPSVFEGMVLEMAERAYSLEHGRPPKTYGELLGTYLKALPDGLEPGDPTSSSN